MPSNNILVVLQILPLLPQQQTIPHIIESTDNQVKLHIPKTPVFSFDLVLNSNTLKEQYDQYLLHELPKSTADRLAQGHDISILFYDSLAVNNRFDTRIILELAQLFELPDLEIYVEFIEFNGLHTQDLISAEQSRPRKSYRIDSIDLALKYYVLGSEQHTRGTSSIYSILLKDQLKTTQFNLINLSGCPHETLMQFSAYCTNQNTQLPFTQLIENSESCIFIGCISPLDSMLELQQTLTYTSTIFNRLNLKKKQNSNERNTTIATASEENPEYLKSLIVKLSNEVNLLRSHSASSTQSSKHGSIFSSISHSTSVTLPDIAEDRKEHVLADLHRQIEELENRMTVTKERNEHVEHELVAIRHTNMELWELSDKQSAFIDVLESKLDHMQDNTINNTMNIQRGMQKLDMERLEIEKNMEVVKNLALYQDDEVSNALEELKIIRRQFEQQRDGTRDINPDGDAPSTQHTRVLKSQDWSIEKNQVQQDHHSEVEKWRHSALVQSAKAKNLEARVNSLENELNVYRKAARDSDISGLVVNLEEHVLRLQQERGELKKNYEAQAQQTKQLESALAEAYQQLVQRDPEMMGQEMRTMKKPSSNRQSIASTESVYRKRKTLNTLSITEKPQLMNWMQEKLRTSDTVDVLQKVSNLADENMELARWVDDLETQLMSQRFHLSQQVKTLECDIMNLTVLNGQLERQIEPRKGRPTAATSQSRQYRSITFNAPPPSEPPNQPLPPIPSPSTDQLKAYKQKVEAAENQVRAHEAHIRKLEYQIESAESKEQSMEQNYSIIIKDLDFQKRRREKAEKANTILEKRLQDLLNKKSKFLCL